MATSKIIVRAATREDAAMIARVVAQNCFSAIR